MIKSCALMTVYNEEDVIVESVTKLIDQGIDVFIFNNMSTDSTIDKISHLVGKGIVDIQDVKFLEDGKD